MKKTKKIWKLTTLVLLLTIAFALVPPNTVSAQQPNITSESTTPPIITREAITGWRYKISNNVLYKRLFNYSTGQWIGDWIRA